jgi:hypothetical protein
MDGCEEVEVAPSIALASLSSWTYCVVYFPGWNNEMKSKTARSP